VVVAAVIGLRRPAAVLAWATVLGEAVLLVRQYDNWPASAVNLFWPFALSVVVAATLTAPAPHRRALSVLRAPRLLTFVLGLCLIQAILLINQHQRAAPQPSGRSYVFYQLENTSEAVLNLWLVTIAVGVLIAALVVLTLPSAVRWRIAVLMTPVVTVAAMVELSLDGWAYSNGNMGHPIYLVTGQWTALVAIPLAAFGLGATLIQRREHIAQLAALGRTVDRERFDN
jgi:hypothetical protein